MAEPTGGLGSSLSQVSMPGTEQEQTRPPSPPPTPLMAAGSAAGILGGHLHQQIPPVTQGVMEAEDAHIRSMVTSLQNPEIPGP
jgi:hypothetical protein